MAIAYKTSVSRFKVKSTPLKDTNGKGKFKWMHSFLLVVKGRLSFQNCPWRSSKVTKFSSRPIGALGLF